MAAGQRLKLSELNLAIRDVISESFDEALWVVAEIARVNLNYSGHTYLDLVEKQGSEILAQAKATIWRSNSRILAEYQIATGGPLKSGVQVLLFVRVDYHPVYGLSLNVREIDANYTLGEMARKRQEILDRLLAENLLDVNRSHIMAEVPQRLAVISSATAAGWEDFRARLEDNPYGYNFQVTLFSAILQGEGAEPSILLSLKQAAEQAAEYDAVVIIRGGGGVVDLSCFDSYLLAKAVALFPLPVVTGIGHERDTSVVDIVAFHRADTPTAAAEYLISRVMQFDVALEGATDRIANLSLGLLHLRQTEFKAVTLLFAETGRRRISEEATGFAAVSGAAAAAVRCRVAEHNLDITETATKLSLRSGDYSKLRQVSLIDVESRIACGLAARFQRAADALDKASHFVASRDPSEALNRGFTITRVNGKQIKHVQDILPGAMIETTLMDGKVMSRAD